MFVQTGKRLFCCLLAALSVLCCFPLQAAAAGHSGTVVFSTFEELQSYCTQEDGYSGRSLSCEEPDLILTEDLEIPSGRAVAFRHFTVPEGITLTVMQGAAVTAYGFTVQGEFLNRGTVFQGDLSGDGEALGIEVSALIPGHVENKGEMTLTNVYGKRNIRWIGSQFTMLETASYGKGLGTDTKEPEPSASPIPEASPTPEASPRPQPAREFFDVLKGLLPRFAVFVLVVILSFILRPTSAAKKKEKASAKTSPRRPAVTDRPRDTLGENHFQRDRRTRISQLDDWLKSGLIDRKEYQELKKRYMQDEP